LWGIYFTVFKVGAVMSKTFRQYEILNKIGAGGMASVYKGRHSILGSPVAIKVLHRELAFDQSFITRFEREAKSAAAIQNPNIVKVLDYGSEDDVYFIVMEFVDGPDLGQIYQTFADSSLPVPAFPAEICMLILHDVAFGLQAAHKMGIVHRDIKPSNMILEKQGLVRIGDFGLARGYNSARELDLTLTGTVLGTPSYMSPEQAAGEPLDHRTDIFSLGVVAYKLLTGNKPFDGPAASDVQRQIITVDPPPLDDGQFPWITAETLDFLDKCLAKDPGKRFADMEQVLRQIRVCQESLDPEGRFVINKYEYLANFAADAVGFTRKVQKESSRRHHKKGLHFKNMGNNRLEDALHEFQIAAALNPENTKARKDIRELEKTRQQVESQGEAPPPTPEDFEPTAILSSDTIPNPVIENTEPRTVSPQKHLWAIAFVVLVMVIFAGVLGTSTRQESDKITMEQPDPQVSSDDSPPPVQAVVDSVPLASAAESDLQKELTSSSPVEEITEIAVEKPDPKPKPVQPVSVVSPEPEKSTTPSGGTVRVRVKPAVDIYLDDKLVRASTSEYLVPALSGKHTIRLQNDAFYLRREIPVKVVGGETLLLDPVNVPLGGLHFGTNALTARVEIDGVEVSHPWPMPILKVAAGEHAVTIRLPGASLGKVMMMRGGEIENLHGLEIEKGVWMIQIVVEEGVKTQVQLRFEVND